ncbi:helix-turn-helix domain-containing protein [Yinghuangia sp. ASG 101]|uniref:helix-turn-helix domain-containing protein n=1 Tax=Yinghuangia sp. ASG 101 TaxID=2896848 RepID=UPI001E61301C|nr:helix-turn-helix transcriptional regulator [Yinghuangia sp. ASG 101]UGQ11155.1 helix-turn-helix domain-containing protein [Yinghuangia sp. ASG 101]
MAEVPDSAIGARVRFHRERRDRTQAVLAGFVGITADYLSQIERGVKTPTIGVLHDLARELQVPITALLGGPGDDEDAEFVPTRGGFGPVERALVGTWPVARAADRVDVTALRERVEEACRTYQSSATRFSAAALVLPDLIADAERAVRQLGAPADAGERREAHRARADLYFLLRSYCKRQGRMSLSMLAADRALHAAQEADDPLRIAAAEWNLGHHLLADNELDGAEAVVRQAADGLGQWRASPSVAAVYGALHLVFAATLSRRRDARGARRVLDGPASAVAAVSGEGNVLWTVFGPANVAVHRVSVEMEAGRPNAGLEIADHVDTAGMASIERRMTHLLEVTRCYEQSRDDLAVLLHLQNAERLAPEDVRGSKMARELVRTLRHRARPSYASDVADLAARVGLLAN